MSTTEKTYKFDELDPIAKNVALEQYRGIHVEHFDWYCNVIDDAKSMGLVITEFDIDRTFEISGDFVEDATFTANKIVSEYSYFEPVNTCKQFLQDRDELIKKYSDGVDLSKVSEDNEWEFDKECDELESEFLQSLLQDYLTILRNEFEFITSDDVVKEWIIDLDIEFNEDGEEI